MVHILYSDGELAVCLKPMGVLSEGQAPNALPSLLEKELGRAVYPVHRLDRMTEGLMVFALSPHAAAVLSRAIAEGKMKKEYLAVVCGAPAEASGSLRDLLFYDRRAGKTYVVDRSRKGVKEALLDYECLEVGDKHSLLRILLHTGRTHQIRAQFASRSLPLVGDRRYGAPAEGQPMALFSHRLSFAHPKTGESMCFCHFPEPLDGTAWAEFAFFSDRENVGNP